MITVKYYNQHYTVVRTSSKGVFIIPSCENYEMQSLTKVLMTPYTKYKIIQENKIEAVGEH